jgi:hypothetical protein
MKQIKFRPHWLLDNGIKIYADDLNDNFYMGVNIYNIYDKIPIEYKCEKTRAKFGKFYEYGVFSQIKGHESEFGILCDNGTYMRGKWIPRCKNDCK